MIFQIPTIILLLFLAYQDFRYRAISWWLIPVLVLAFGYLEISTIGRDQFLANIALNLGFIVFQMAVLTMYFSMRNRKFTNIINTYLGIGDVLFFVLLAAAFSFVNYIFFLVTSFILVTIGFMIFKSVKRNTNPEIPLAGAMSLILVISMACNAFVNIDFYNDNIIPNFLISQFPDSSMTIDQ